MDRVEPLEIPEDGLREILYNSVCHKEYMGAPIQMHVYADHVEVWNEGGLPNGYTAETLMCKHSSRPRNKTIAAVMFRAGFIEAWGRGYTKVRESFEADDYPMPVITEIDGGVSVWIKRFSLDELAARNKKRYGDKAPNLQGTDSENVGINVGDDFYNKLLKLTERQRLIYNMIKDNPSITAKEMSVQMSVNKRTIERELSAMSSIVRHEGSRKIGYWRIITNESE